MTSLASTKGPSMTLSLPSAILTCAPVCSGISPPLSTMRPALISRSEIFWMAPSSSGEGPVIGCGEVTIYMKRIGKLLLRRGRQHRPAYRKTIQPAADRHACRKKLGCLGAERPPCLLPLVLLPFALLPQHDQRIGAVGHQSPLRVVVGLEPPGLALVRHQHDLAALEPPLRRRECRDLRIAFRLQEHLEIIVAG